MLNQSASLYILICHHAHVPVFALFLFIGGLINWFVFGWIAFPGFHASEMASKEFLGSGFRTISTGDGRAVESVVELILLRKSMKATRPLICDVAGAFKINFDFMLNFYNVMVDVTVNAILLF